ncbi:ribosome biogenesis GTP-binding protein YihA/YsxC [Acidiferrobacter sp.]|uniref:ribosome biogenesis GTP-binding protein YihA/YsxC n=1 Tax=Acidiferrobacter sp. TaxID=1872107 RepID=UPI0026184CFA|nr:ribosome biogenesis GTP-binding protein YihA/YsxC [Acidiferrobacter sp.]
MPTLRDAVFLLGAPRVRDLPPDIGAEVAFAGRSNAGKSSALNALTGHTGLARVSKTPGRTQQLNVFGLADDRRLIDLPGYGYARVPQALRHTFIALTTEYLERRQSLKGLVLLADIRQGLKTEDHMLLQSRTDIPILVLLSKADKINRGERQRTLREMVKIAPETAYLLPFSAHTGDGLEETRDTVLQWLGLAAADGPT